MNKQDLQGNKNSAEERTWIGDWRFESVIKYEYKCHSHYVQEYIITRDLEKCHQIMKKTYCNNGGLELLKSIASNDPPEDHPQQPQPSNQPHWCICGNADLCPCPHVAENVLVWQHSNFLNQLYWIWMSCLLQSSIVAMCLLMIQITVHLHTGKLHTTNEYSGTMDIWEGVVEELSHHV